MIKISYISYLFFKKLQTCFFAALPFMQWSKPLIGLMIPTSVTYGNGATLPKNPHSSVLELLSLFTSPTFMGLLTISLVFSPSVQKNRFSLTQFMKKRIVVTHILGRNDHLACSRRDGNAHSDG